MELSESSSSVGAADLLPDVGISVKFTEVDPVNISYKDHEGDDDGWVELANNSADTVDLSGMFLTDSKENPEKWKLGNVVVPPYSFLVIFMSGKNYPDYVMPHDSVDMIGHGCWTWTDAQSDPPGYSYADPLEGQRKNCFGEGGKTRFGAVMKLGDNEELGWSSIAVFVGTGSSNPEDVLDISKTNEILIQAYITQDRKVSFRLTQPDVDDWKGYEIILTGTGDSSTVYRTAVPTGSTFPDLANIYGTRMSPEANETQEVTVKVFSYIARNSGHEPHANFKLNKSGGSLYLMNAEHVIVDSIAYPHVPVGMTWSMGGLNGGLGFGYAEPSPYGLPFADVNENRSPALDTLADLPPSGFFKEPFEIHFPDNGDVHCGKGGLAPIADSPVVTTLSIDSTTTLRCAAFTPGALPGDEVFRTYVLDDSRAVPVVFVTADPNSLFDPDTGIYMEGNFAQEKEPHYGANYWLDKEIPVAVELLEPGTNEPAFAKRAGLKIFGNYSRQNNKKSVAITFREKYGDSRLKYQLFPEFPELNKFKVFLLRNNGSNFPNDYIRDRLASSVSEGLGVDYQRGRFAVVYYNGEYFGIHSIRERSTEYYFETHYGIDPNAVDLIKADNAVSAGSAVDYVALMDWLETHHLDDEDNYAYMASQIDVDNYMNYMHTEIYANNRDWPANNMKKWRGTNPKTKWKWFLYDLDFGMGNDYSEYTNNIFEFATAEDGEGWPNGPEHTLLLRRMLENEGFRAAFVNRMAVLLQMNFSSSRVLNRIEKMMSEIESEVPQDQKRWGQSKTRMAEQLEMIKDFAKERPGVVLAELMEYFELGEIAEVTLSATGPGTVAVHGLKLDVPTLKVPFFKGHAVTVSAEPTAGGVFDSWSDGSKDISRTIDPESVASLTAIFK
ncbi:CotH kinase family protein [Fibrobacter sp.]|uniref:CotH kinase family protein n=1 Tax=Fibrobacter sp. TaxID=35828 RepID=UPI0025C6CB9C|nr:CotH kinase family protein [Fibrobacter sp.]